MKTTKLLSALVLSVSVFFSGCSDTENHSSEQSEIIKTETTAVTTLKKEESRLTSGTAIDNSEETEQSMELFTENLTVHFIDVGQGDCTFIELPNGETMLIDAGETDQGDKVTTYINSQGYDEIDYTVATHAHSDHIGGMPEVLRTLEADDFYMTSAIATTNIYEEMLNVLKSTDTDVHSVMAGDVILDENNLLVEVVAPVVIDEKEQNNNSVVIKLTYENSSFLFTGDAEEDEENDITHDIDCDVLKVGHHGSDTSSSVNFLDKVNPSYAVISCGMNNSYGHPTDELLKRLYDRNINVYRTDLQGTVIFTSNGNDVSINTNPVEHISDTSQITENLKENSVTYVLNTNTMKIHYADCSSVDQMKEVNKEFTSDYEQAIADGYTPCGICKP
ncbi:MAG: MBL fold metallo-hydrolase [Oscillospiraceae bacterium]|nr:MBL fold metallo-hydrolase [Oscillospiraceae bacterium]